MFKKKDLKNLQDINQRLRNKINNLEKNPNGRKHKFFRAIWSKE